VYIPHSEPRGGYMIFGTKKMNLKSVGYDSY
jgi:hypothetical protein